MSLLFTHAHAAFMFCTVPYLTLDAFPFFQSTSTRAQSRGALFSVSLLTQLTADAYKLIHKRCGHEGASAVHIVRAPLWRTHDERHS